MRFVLVLLGLTAAVSPASVLACKCEQPVPAEPGAVPSSAARGPDPNEAIFEGTVAKAQFKGSFLDAKMGDLISANLDVDDLFMLVSFDVARSYAGERAKSVELRTGLGGGDCGYPFEVGKTYLVYAWKDERSGKLRTNICSGTGLVEDRKANIASLRGEAPVAAEPGGTPVEPTRLCGHVVNANQAASPDNRVLLISVGSKSPAPTDEAELNDDGSFCTTNLEPGAYYLLFVGSADDAPTSFAYYPGVTKFADAKTVNVARGQPIENLLLKVPYQPTYSVSGSVAGLDKSAAELQPRVFLFNSEDPRVGLDYSQDVAADGSFKFKQVLAGKYWAMVMVDDDASKWYTTKVAVEVDNTVSGASVILVRK
jgi:hypothetical protein